MQMQEGQAGAVPLLLGNVGAGVLSALGAPFPRCSLTTGRAACQAAPSIGRAEAMPDESPPAPRLLPGCVAPRLLVDLPCPVGKPAVRQHVGGRSSKRRLLRPGIDDIAHASAVAATRWKTVDER